MFNQLNIIKINTIIKSQFCIGNLKSTLAFNNNALIYGFVYNLSLYNYQLIWKSLLYFYKFFSYIIFKRNFILIVSQNQTINKSLQESKLLNKYHFFFFNELTIPGFLTNMPSIKLKKKRYKKLNNKFSKFYFSKKTHPDLILSFDTNYYIFKEALMMKIPVIGLIDTNNNLFNFLYKIYMNNQSENSLLFFIKILEKSLLQGLWYEQNLFFKLLLEMLNKKLKNV